MEQALWDMVTRFAGKLDLVIVFVVFVVALSKRWLVFWHQYEDKVGQLEKAERIADKWERAALRGTSLADNAVAAVQSIAQQPRA